MMLAKLGYAPGQYNPNFGILLHGVTLLGGWLGWGSQHLSSSCTCTQFRSNKEALAGYNQLPKGEREGLLYWSQAFYSKVLEEQVVPGLW